MDKETHQLATQVYNRYPKSAELSWTVGELERFEHSTIEPTEPSAHASATDERDAPFAGRVGDGAPTVRRTRRCRSEQVAWHCSDLCSH